MERKIDSEYQRRQGIIDGLFLEMQKLASQKANSSKNYKGSYKYFGAYELYGEHELFHEIVKRSDFSNWLPSYQDLEIPQLSVDMFVEFTPAPLFSRRKRKGRIVFEIANPYGEIAASTIDFNGSIVTIQSSYRTYMNPLQIFDKEEQSPTIDEIHHKAGFGDSDNLTNLSSLISVNGFEQRSWGHGSISFKL